MHNPMVLSREARNHVLPWQVPVNDSITVVRSLAESGKRNNAAGSRTGEQWYP